MRSDFVVLSEPDIDGRLRLFGGVEPLGIQDFGAQRSIEAFVVSILPGIAWVDLDWLYDARTSRIFLASSGTPYGLRSQAARSFGVFSGSA